MHNMNNLRQQFIAFALASGVLRFGEFVTKAGRTSPYFFNAGLFSNGGCLGQLGQFYAQTLLDSGLEFDMLFGPAYKGITLASSTAIALANKGRDVAFAFNRKEAKDHGEGGSLVGAPLQGRVVIVDDVISAGTSVRESVNMIRTAGATPCAVLIALDRMERCGTEDALSKYSAVQEITLEYGIPVISIGNLDDLLNHLANADSNHGTQNELSQHQAAVAAYRSRYGVV